MIFWKWIFTNIKFIGYDTELDNSLYGSMGTYYSEFSTN